MGRPKGSKNKHTTSKQVICKICNTTFIVSNSRKDMAKFCSYYCYWKAQKTSQYTGKNHSCWKGGKYKKASGYIMIHRPHHPFRTSDGYIREHRYVMEQHLKRHLRPTEIIHHINENTSDNRLENLMLFPNSTAHLAYHRLLKSKT